MVLLSLLTVGGTSVSFTYLTILETLIGGEIASAAPDVIQEISTGRESTH